MIARLAPAVARYRNTGVRIEEMYLITSNGVERPSSSVPRGDGRHRAAHGGTGDRRILSPPHDRRLVPRDHAHAMSEIVRTEGSSRALQGCLTGAVLLFVALLVALLVIGSSASGSSLLPVRSRVEHPRRRACRPAPRPSMWAMKDSDTVRNPAAS